MKEITGNLFDPSTYQPQLVGPVDAICITTNLFVKKSGEAVMGRGCAREAARLMPGLPSILGNHISDGLHGVLAHGDWHKMVIVTFPVKPASVTCGPSKSNIVRHMRDKFDPGDRVPGWAAVADLELIQQSARELAEMAEASNWKHVVIPRMGCGMGELNWHNFVKPAVETILDDRFYVITFPNDPNK